MNRWLRASQRDLFLIASACVCFLLLRGAWRGAVPGLGHMARVTGVVVLFAAILNVWEHADEHYGWRVYVPVGGGAVALMFGVRFALG